MEIREMQMEDIEARKAEIEVEMTSEDADLDELTSEVDELNARKAELNALAETREAEIEEVIEERGTVIMDNILEVKAEEREFSVDSMEYRNAWLSHIQSRQNETYATTDSYTAIPTLVANKFVEKLKAIAPMIDEITCLRAAGAIKFVVEGTNNAAAAHTENSAISAAADTIVTVELGVVEYAKIIKISKSVQSMSIDAFEDWLLNLLARDIARSIDNHIINHASNGIVNGTYSTGTNQIVNTGDYTYADICSLIALLPAGYDPTAKFLVSKKVLWEDVKGMVDDNGRPIFDATSKTLCGYPVIIDDYVPTTDKGIYLADWTEAVVGNLSTPIEVESSEVAGFATGTIDFRGFAGFDSKLTMAGANIVRLVATA